MPRSRAAPSSLLAFVLVATAGLAAADITDWVNVGYVLKQASAGTAGTSAARQGIVSKAGTTAKSGPWSVVDKNGVKPPNGDVHDYLSWAPYYWPNCNWCSKGTNHLSGPSRNGTDDGLDDDDDDGDNSLEGNEPYEDGGADADEDDNYGTLSADLVLLPRDVAYLHGAHRSHLHRRMLRRRRPIPEDSASNNTTQQQDVDDDCVNVLLATEDTPDAPAAPAVPAPADAPATPDVSQPLPTGIRPTDGVAHLTHSRGTTSTSTRSYTAQPMRGTPAPADAHAKPKKTTKTTEKCTPSPTKSLAPSATWTTCPYTRRDGNRNPDVDKVPNSQAVVVMSKSVVYNAVAFAMGKPVSYSQTAAKFIDAWFLASATAMNPNMNFGQLIRGPGKEHQQGSYTGILDMRELVKVANGIQLLKAAGSPDWTSARDKAMVSWTKSYISWLQNSALGKEVAEKGNNHRTFYAGQLAAMQMLAGDTKGAQATLKAYFAGPFLDQVAASGEQPFEAIRTKPFHYRCFNIEAMIVNAKLGDQLGLNLWTSKSKYGTTIQTAVDFVMKMNPKGEDVTEAAPHVAAVAAAYGDPKGKYANFLKQKDSTYTNELWWFYDQTDALPNSPAGRAKTTKSRREIVIKLEQDYPTDSAHAQPDVNADLRMAEGVVAEAGSAVEAEGIPFECPAVTQLDEGVFATCDEMKPYYMIVDAVNTTSVV